MNFDFLKVTDPVLTFSILLFIIMIFPFLFKKIKLPSIVGLIVAGVIVGPHTIGILEKNSAITLLSKVGILYIMFLAGLEVNLFQIKKNISNTLIFGVLTFIIPLFIGTTVSFFILKLNIPTSILLASMFSSHTLLTYSIVSKLGLLKNNSVTTAIGGTIITDVLALLVLAIITSSSHEKNSILFWVKFSSFLILYTVATVLLVPLIGKWFFKSHSKNEIVEFIFVLFIVFICGYFAHIAGLEPIIGAFLAGLILNSLIPKKSILMNRIDFIGNSLFIPIFLISVGMLINVKTLFIDKKAWIVSICMIIIAILSKFIAAILSGKILKWSKNEIGLVYGMSVNQAAATLAAVLVGYELKFFDDSILTGTIMMIATTCFLGPIITEIFGKKTALAEEKQDIEHNRQNLRILVPINNKEHIRDLMELSFILYKKYSTDAIYPVNIVMDSFDIERKIIESEKLLAHAVVKSIAANINVSPVTRVDMSVGAGITKAIRDLRISCVIAGWDGKQKFLGKTFGNIIDPIIEGSDQLLIINKIIHPLGASNRIVLLIPPNIDKQEGFEELLNIIKIIASQFKTKLLIITTENCLNDSSQYFQSLRKTIKLDTQPLNNWKNIDEIIKRNINKDDTIALFSVRVTRPAWQPLLNKLPVYLSKNYPSNNIMILFSSEEKWYSRDIEENLNREYLFQIIKNENFYFDLENYDLHEAFSYILYKCFGKNINTLNNLSNMLTNIARNEPVELLPDVILIHAHISEISDYAIYIGVNHNGFDIPNLSEKIKIIIVLLNSIDKPAEHHLELLKEIVQLLKTPNFIDSLKKSNSFEEFQKKINSV